MGWWHQGQARGNAAAWDRSTARMFLLPAWQSQTGEDGSKMGRFTLDPTSWDTIGMSGDGQALVVTAGAQSAWPKL